LAIRAMSEAVRDMAKFHRKPVVKQRCRSAADSVVYKGMRYYPAFGFGSADGQV